MSPPALPTTAAVRPGTHHLVAEPLTLALLAAIVMAWETSRLQLCYAKSGQERPDESKSRRAAVSHLAMSRSRDDLSDPLKKDVGINSVAIVPLCGCRLVQEKMRRESLPARLSNHGTPTKFGSSRCFCTISYPGLISFAPGPNANANLGSDLGDRSSIR
jgi:hypothetical protein